MIEGQDLEGPGNGLDSLPMPISTPGFDAAPYITMTGVITRDPETGVQNMGTYRGHLKSPTRLGMMMLVNLRAGGLDHWRKYAARGEPMPVAIVVGAPPVVAFQGPQKLRPEVDELGVAGGLAGAPISVVKRPHRRSAGAGRSRTRGRGLRRPRLSRARRPVRRIATAMSRSKTTIW